MANAYSEGNPVGERNPFRVDPAVLDDGPLRARLLDYARSLRLYAPFEGAGNDTQRALSSTTRALYDEAVRRGLPLFGRPRLPWD